MKKNINSATSREVINGFLEISFPITTSTVNLILMVKKIVFSLHSTKLELHLKQFVPTSITQLENCNLPSPKLTIVYQ
jgi:hypothetical protein